MTRIEYLAVTLYEKIIQRTIKKKCEALIRNDKLCYFRTYIRETFNIRVDISINAKTQYFFSKIIRFFRIRIFLSLTFFVLNVNITYYESLLLVQRAQK